MIMPPQIPKIQWTWNRRASGLHAAEAWRRHLHLTDTAWFETLRAPSEALQVRIQDCGGDPEMIWRHLHGLSPSVTSSRQLAQQALQVTLGLPQAEVVEGLERALDALDAGVARVQPRLEQELELRAEPLRLQWEARGPGLLRQMATRVDNELLVPHVNIILVHPLLGGGGEAHLLYDSVRLEGVLYHPHPELPETLRLAWLIAQLNQEVPGYSEAIDPDRLHDLAAIALVPAALMAADYVELARFDEPTLCRAMELWHVPRLVDNQSALVWDWWQTFCETRPHWRIALQALERMVDRKCG
jgi:hypothetical protein